MIKRLGILMLLVASVGCKGPGGRPPRGGGKNDASGADFVKRLDKDGDGKVSKGEFDGPAKIFAELDRNGDGFLAADEAPSGPPPGGRR
ncbi:hypothetical protein [Pontiella sp.]|uniref:hypothetical protein n=1 Tax=Pontiella sp. TaxID=2837462 RepID=UPI0035637E97